MTIKTIPRSKFDQLLPCPSILGSLMGEELAWFSNRSGTMLGVIAKGTGAAGWNYVILKRDKKGSFHIRKVMSNFFNLNAARVDFMFSMREIGTVNNTNRESANSWLPPVPTERPRWQVHQ